MGALAGKNVVAAEYDADRSELTVSFADGDAYTYSMVPASLAERLEHSGPEADRFFYHNIRSVFPYRRAA